MSRLQRMRARLTTQEACLDYAAGALRDITGPVFEVGLGKGRTYDHLCALFTDRDVHAFDRDVHAPAEFVPEQALLWLGDFRDTLPRAREQVSAPALIHADVGSGSESTDRQLAEDLAPLFVELLQPGGLLLTDLEYLQVSLQPVALPAGVGDFPYFMFRAG